jgi:mRNA-degrading endonuclease RelE of RelBE toxin-antitoxin system
MVYEVNDQIVIVVAIGKRDKSEVYVKAAQRLISEIVN